MLKMRLRRMGAKKKPFYRLVIAESSAPRDGAFIEVLGTYNPKTDPATIQIDSDKARDWLRKGAQPTERVAKLLAKTGVTEAQPTRAASA